MPAKKHEHDDNCLHEASKHVGFVLRMMGAMAGAVTVDDGAELVGLALLEAYLNHVRCLHEFLAKPPNRQWSNIVRAVSYLPNPDAPVIACLPGDTYHHLSSKVSHVACDREDSYSWAGGDSADRTWLADVVIESFEGFLDRLRQTDNASMADWFQSDLDLAMSHLADSRAQLFAYRRA